MKTESRVEQIAGIAAVVFLVVGVFVVLRPFVSAILWAAILCFSTWPLYSRIERKFNNRRTVAATLMTLLIALVLVVPFVIASISLADNISNLIKTVQTTLNEGAPEPPAWVARVPVVGRFAQEYWHQVAQDTGQFIQKGKGYLTKNADKIVASAIYVLHGIMQLSLSVFIAFFFYRDGAKVVERLQGAANKIIGDRTQHLLAVVGGTVKGVVYGILGTALAQGILAAFGFWIAGVPAPLLFGLLTFFLSLVPMGPPLVWIPATIWLIMNGRIGWGIFLGLWGLLIVSGVDNLLKPYLISRGSNLPFVLVFLGVLGGVIAFGFIGVFIGPTLLAVAYSLVQEWTSNRALKSLPVTEPESVAETAPAP